MNESPGPEKSGGVRKPKSKLESRTFKDGGIYLFQRADYVKPTWFCRIKVPNAKGYTTASTGTVDIHAAYSFAEQLYNKNLVRALSGQEINSKQTTLAIQEYIAHVEANENKMLSRSIKIGFMNKWIIFFKNVRLKEIDTSTIIKMNEWTKSQSTKGTLSPNTVKRFSSYLKQFFNWCLERAYIDTLPKFPRMKTTLNRRPHFDAGDWNKLTRHMREFVKATNPNIVRDRTLVVNYVLILGNTGIRPGEARTLKWRDLREIPAHTGSENPPDIALFVSGKTGKREVVASKPDIKRYFQRILELRVCELGHKPDSTDYVFCNRDGYPVGSFKNSFSALLKSAGLEKDTQGAKRTIYSLRHTYATFRLHEGVHHYLLAKNMGTSTAMLEKHYGHTSSVESASELTKGGSFKGVKKAVAIDWLME